MKISSKDLQARHKIWSDDIANRFAEEEYPPGFQVDPTKWQSQGWHADQSDTMNQRIGETPWEQVDKEEMRKEMFTAYRKYIEVTLHEEAPGEQFQPSDDYDSGRLEFFIAISPSSMRAEIELERANFAKRDKDYEKEQKHRQNAEQFAAIDGWEYDLEVSWNENIIFHRERTFRSQSSEGKFPLSGSGLSRAIAKASELIDNEIDNKTVGEFFEMIRGQKTRGPTRLSTEEDITAAYGDGDDDMDVAQPTTNHSAQLQMFVGAAMEALENLKHPRISPQQREGFLNEVSQALIRISQYTSTNLKSSQANILVNAAAAETAILDRMRSHNVKMQEQIATMAYHVGVIMRALESTSVQVDTGQRTDRVVLDTAKASAQALQQLVTEQQRMVG